MSRLLRKELFIIVAIISISGQSRAQSWLHFFDTVRYDFSSKPVILGDTDHVGGWRFTKWPCQGDHGYTSDTSVHHNAFAWLRTEDGAELSVLGLELGTLIDTTFDYFAAANCGGQQWFETSYTTALVIPDSLVLVRPRSATVDLNADTINGGWSGIATYLFSNNISETSNFSEFTLDDTTNNYSISVERNGTSINKLFLGLFESKVPITVRFKAKRGPINSSLTTNVMHLRIHVRNQDMDSVYSQEVQLRLAPAPYTRKSRFADGTLRIDSKPGVRVTKRVVILKDPTTRTAEVLPSGYPLQTGNAVNRDSTFEFDVASTARSGGSYHGVLRVLFTVNDYNGDSRKDTLIIPVIVAIDRSLDSVSWQRLPDPLIPIGEVHINSQKVIYIDNFNRIYSSTDDGESWVAFDANGLQINQWLIIDDAEYAYSTFGYPVPMQTGYLMRCKRGGQAEQTGLSGYIYSAGLTPQGEIYGYGASTAYIYPAHPSAGVKLDIFSFHSGNHRTAWSSAPEIEPQKYRGCDSNGGAVFFPFYDPRMIAVTPNGDLFTASSEWTALRKKGTSGWLNTQLLTQGIQGMAAAADGRVYIGTQYDGVLVSDDSGKTWNGINGGLAGANVRHMICQPNGYIFAFTDSGVYRSTWHPIKAPTQTVEPQPVVSELDLYQNYPNPASPITELSFDLSQSGITSLVVRDVLGRVVAEPVNGMMSNGRHTLSFDASSLTRGVYMYTLTQGSMGVTRRMAVSY